MIRLRGCAVWSVLASCTRLIVGFVVRVLISLFAFSVTAIEHHKTLLIEPTGSICSPGFPSESYPNNYHHVYNFMAPPKHTIYLTIHLDLEYQLNCIYDSIRTFGMTTEEILCGNTTEKYFIMSMYNNCSIEFLTDDDVTATGFQLSWYWINITLPFQYHQDSITSGIVSSLNFPHTYPQATSGCATLYAPNGHRLLFEFKKLIMPGLTCTASKIEIYSGNQLLKKVCGNDSLSSMSYFEWIILSFENTLDICISLPVLKEGEGFIATLIYGEYMYLYYITWTR